MDNKEPTYVTYPGGNKIDIMEIDRPLLLDEMHAVDDDRELNQIKIKIKTRVDQLADFCIEKRGPIKDVSVFISGPEKNQLTKVVGPVWEVIEDYNTKKKYIRYARSIEFID